MIRCKPSEPLAASLSFNHRSPRQLAAFLLRLTESREERERTNLFYTDGLRFVSRVAESPHIRPVAFVHAPEMLAGQRYAAQLIQTLKERHPTIPLLVVPPALLQRLSLAPEPQGIGAVVQQMWTPLYRLSADAGLCYVALDTLHSPGNLGTVLRTLEAVGGSGLICLPPEEREALSIDPFSPGVIRATMGSAFALRFAHPTESEWERWRKKNGVLLVGTSPHASDDYRSLRYGERVVLWMGGERRGLSDAQMARCDRLVRIPMAPGASADSLNLATATSILLYELFHQRNG